MFSYFLNPKRLLLSALLLLMCSFFVIPINRVDTHFMFLLSSGFYIIAYFKVKKNGIEYYAEKIKENRKMLIAIFAYVIVIILIDSNRFKPYDENLNIILRTISLIPLGILASLFFHRVFLKK